VSYARSRRPAGWVAVSSVVVALILVLLAIGTASATPVVVKKPPFTGGALYSHVQLKHTFGCNSIAHDPIPGSFNVTTGVARVYSKVTAQVCSRASGGATFVGYLGVTGIDFRVSTSGRYNVSAFWGVLAGVNISISYHGTKTSSLSGYVQLIPTLCILDMTAGNGSCKSAHPFGTVSSTTGMSTNISSSFAEILPGWYLASGDAYEFKTYVGYSLIADAATPAGVGSSVSVTLDMHSRGYGASLESVTVVR